MKNKKLVLGAVSAALVASVVAPITTEVSASSNKAIILNTKVITAEKIQVKYVKSGKTYTKTIKPSVPVKNGATIAKFKLHSENRAAKISNGRFYNPNLKSFNSCINKAESSIYNGNYNQAIKMLKSAELHLNRVKSNYASSLVLKQSKNKLNTLKLQVGLTNETIKALTSTIIELNFKDVQTSINPSQFKIKGLEVKSAVLKQLDSKTIILTTEKQEADKEYLITMNGKELGTFMGSNIDTPTKISFESKSLSSKAGENVKLKVNIGSKTAGVKITFNIDGENGKLNQDILKEVLTDENGIATYEYTQYGSGAKDVVYAYVTGDPTVRDMASVYWNANDNFSITVKDNNSILNGQSKEYTVIVKDPITGLPMSNEEIHVLLKENIGKTNGTNAVLKSLYGAQTNGSQRETGANTALVLKTDINGKVIFSISGENTTATPLVYRETVGDKFRYDGTEESAVGPSAVFVGAQVSHVLTVEQDEQTVSNGNIGRIYTLSVTDKTGKAFENGYVNIGFKELLNNNYSSTTDAKIIWFDNDTSLKTKVDASTSGVTVLNNGNGEEQIRIQLNKYGKATFMIASQTTNYAATPLIWIDQDMSNIIGLGNQKLENEEPFVVAGVTYFKESTISGANLTINKQYQAVNQISELNFSLLNQSGLEISTPSTVTTIEYTITNTGKNGLSVIVPNTNNFNGSFTVNGQSKTVASGELVVVSPGQTATIIGTTVAGTSKASFNLSSTGETTYSVSAKGNVKNTTNTQNIIYVSTSTITGSFTQGMNLQSGNTYSGKVIGFDTEDSNGNSGTITIELVGTGQTVEIPYFKEASALKSADQFMLSGSNFTFYSSTDADTFEQNLKIGNNILVEFENNNPSKLIFDTTGVVKSHNQLKDTTAPKVLLTAIENQQTDTSWNEVGEKLTLTFSEPVNLTDTVITLDELKQLTGVSTIDNTIASASPTMATFKMTKSGSNQVSIEIEGGKITTGITNVNVSSVGAFAKIIDTAGNSLK